MSDCLSEEPGSIPGEPANFMLYRVVVPHFVCGLIVEDGIVRVAAPIMGWAVDKHINYVRHWMKGKQGTVEQI